MTRNDKVGAVIATFFPDEGNLNNISFNASQVTELFLFDDTPHDKLNFFDRTGVQLNLKMNFHNLHSKHHNVHHIFNGENVALPINYNRSLQLALDLGAEFLILIDQDWKINEQTIFGLFKIYFKLI